MLILMSSDAVLREELRAAASTRHVEFIMVDDLARVPRMQLAGASSIVVDLNLGDEVLPHIGTAKRDSSESVVIACLDHFVGDLPIRAKLAGADRVIPRSQLARELADILGKS